MAAALVNDGRVDVSGRSGRGAGRRPGPGNAADDILAAARALFAERGPAGTTVRAVAAAAGVSPGLVIHFFGTKDELFLAALQLPVNPLNLITAAIDGGPRAELGERLARLAHSAWHDPVSGPPLQAAMRAGVGAEANSALLRAFAGDVLVPRLAAVLGVSRETMAGLASQVVGYAVLGVVLGVEPLASLDADAVAALLGPALQGYLDREPPRTGRGGARGPAAGRGH